MTVDVADLASALEGVLGLPAEERLAPLARLARRVLEQGAAASPATRARVVAALVAAVEEGEGMPEDRLAVGEVLGLLGDPRLHTPADADYWVRVVADEGPIAIGRYPVTNAEYRRFVDAGGYDDRALWSEGGQAWLRSCKDPWPVRADADDAAPYVVPNQPVVGVTWWEAEAYARYAQARLPRLDERIQVMRGAEKRPYPWGSPFGEGNANTREEVLGRPCAVGLFTRDRTPDGVCDMAGNVAEWAGDGVGDMRWYHPGAWDQPSMAAWAKARELDAPEARSTGLGFRLAKG